MQLRNVVVLMGAILATLVLAACQAAEPGASTGDTDLQVTRITADDLANVAAGARLSLQASERDDVILFDPSRGSLDFGKIELTCPNGQQMGMDTWLTALEQSHGVDIGAMTGDIFSLALAKQTAADGLDVQDSSKESRPQGYEQGGGQCCTTTCLEQSCYLCTDGQWVCSCIRWTTTCSDYCEALP